MSENRELTAISVTEVAIADAYAYVRFYTMKYTSYNIVTSQLQVIKWKAVVCGTWF